MNVYLRKDTSYSAPILYVLKIIEKNRNIEFTFVNSPMQAQLIWDDKNTQSENIALAFYSNFKTNKDSLKHSHILDSSLRLKDEKGHIDLIATIFYMINCLQEFGMNDGDLDNFGRFKYTSSYQHSFKNIEENIVEQLIDEFCTSNGLVGSKEKSTFFISHDIDTIYGSFFQDGFWALKKMRIGTIMNLIALELSRKPHWKNIDKIIQINSEKDIRSTFFWLVNQGKGLRGIKNADYKIKDEQILLDMVEKSGNVNGLHKSCSSMSIDDELIKGNINSSYNRYHFLNFIPSRDWKKISASKLNFDCSLGFSEHYGFRNSYGKAFQPFNIIENKPFNFVEAPLTFMDTTFHKYMNYPINEIANTIIQFYEKNALNCNLSLLWHNTYFTKYKYNSFLEEYKKVLCFIYESQIQCHTPDEIIKENSLEW